MSYNGWTNRETWLVNLHFGDDLVYLLEGCESSEDLENKIMAVVDEQVRDGIRSIEYVLENEGSAFFSDLLPDLYSLAREVNYSELVDSWLAGWHFCTECETWFEEFENPKMIENDDETFVCGDCAEVMEDEEE